MRVDINRVAVGVFPGQDLLCQRILDFSLNQPFERPGSIDGVVSFARQFFNDSVMTYNNLIQSVPSNLIARLFDFTPAEYFEGGPEAQTVPKVDLR